MAVAFLKRKIQGQVGKPADISADVIEAVSAWLPNKFFFVFINNAANAAKYRTAIFWAIFPWRVFTIFHLIAPQNKSS